MPIRTYAQAMNEATEQLLRESRQYFLIGEGVPDPKGAFSTTTGLKEKFPDRVFDMPVSENGMTGVCIGAAASGMRPIMVHMRPDFMMLAMDQLVNMAAKLHFMYGGQLKCPMVIRAIVGRGWGQGCQHSQHLERMFAMVPGLKVYYPYDAYTAKGLLIKAARGQSPVIFFEHRWLHDTVSEVPNQMYEVDEKDQVLISENESIFTHGYMVGVSRKAIEFLAKQRIFIGLEARVRIKEYHRGHEIKDDSKITPPSPNLVFDHYTKVSDLVSEFGGDPTEAIEWEKTFAHDVPNKDFMGPF